MRTTWFSKRRPPCNKRPNSHACSLVRLGQDHADAPKPLTHTLAKGVRRRSHGSLPVFGRSEILLSLHLALLPPEALLLSTLDSSGIGGRGR